MLSNKRLAWRHPDSACPSLSTQEAWRRLVGWEQHCWYQVLLLFRVQPLTRTISHLASSTPTFGATLSVISFLWKSSHSSNSMEISTSQDVLMCNCHLFLLLVLLSEEGREEEAKFEQLHIADQEWLAGHGSSAFCQHAWHWVTSSAYGLDLKSILNLNTHRKETHMPEPKQS